MSGPSLVQGTEQQMARVGIVEENRKNSETKGFGLASAYQRTLRNNPNSALENSKIRVSGIPRFSSVKCHFHHASRCKWLFSLPLLPWWTGRASSRAPLGAPCGIQTGHQAHNSMASIANAPSPWEEPSPRTKSCQPSTTGVVQTTWSHSTMQVHACCATVG